MAAPAKPYGRGPLSLLVLAAAAGLPGCAPEPEDVPQTLVRAGYDSVDDCARDWGSEAECEPQEFDPQGMDRAASGAAQASGGGGSGGGYRRWWGPYYSQSGTVYHYDGRESRLVGEPARANTFRSLRASASQLYGMPGRYASTPAHAQAGVAKTGASGRGGFGRIGRAGGFFGGG